MSKEFFEGIVITKKRIAFHYRDGGKHRSKVVKPEELPFYMWEPIQLREISLKRLFEVIEPATELWEVLLQEHISDYLLESKMPPKKDDSDTGMQVLEVYWDASSKTHGDQTTFRMCPAFHGRGKYQGEETTYAIEFSPMYDLVQYPVQLNHHVEVEVNNFDKKDIGSRVSLGYKPFTVLEAFKGIFWEIAFLGTPEERDKQADIIRERASEIEDGTVECVPFEDIKARIREKLDEQKKSSFLLGDDNDPDQDPITD